MSQLKIPSSRFPRAADDPQGFQRVQRRRQDRWLAMAFAAGLVLVFVVPYERLPPLVCPFRRLLGIPCLTCGGTRTALALSRLELGHAFLMNPLVFLAVLGTLVFTLRVAWAALSGRDRAYVDFRSGRPLFALRVGVLVAVVANWAYLIWVGR